jgi:anti-sigma regulatory factor (Ser/Thr protein kinase)
MTLPTSIRVEEASGVGEARRLAASWCRAMGLGETRTAEASIIASELATNLIKHTAGAGGEIIFRPLRAGDAVGVELLALDAGPGIVHVGASLRDGHSTAGSAGTGLGAIRRMSAEFDVYSAPGKGTAILSRLWKDGSTVPRRPFAVDGVSVPAFGEARNGDAWAILADDRRALLLVADGLGHGPDAADAAERATTAFHAAGPLTPAAMVTRLHAQLAGTRGAAIGVAELRRDDRTMSFAGVGNISAAIIAGGDVRHAVSFNGTAGVEVRRVEGFAYPWPRDSLVVLHSDGASARWTLDDYPGLGRRTPALIAGVLYRDHHRSRDDVTVVVAREADWQ